MKKTYILKSFHIINSFSQKDIENRKRKIVEKILGYKLFDYEWVEYKKIIDINWNKDK